MWQGLAQQKFYFFCQIWPDDDQTEKKNNWCSFFEKKLAKFSLIFPDKRVRPRVQLGARLDVLLGRLISPIISRKTKRVQGL